MSVTMYPCVCKCTHMHAFIPIYLCTRTDSPFPRAKFNVRGSLLFYVPDYASPVSEVAISLEAYEAAGEGECIRYDHEGFP